MLFEKIIKRNELKIIIHDCSNCRDSTQEKIFFTIESTKSWKLKDSGIIGI